MKKRTFQIGLIVLFVTALVWIGIGNTNNRREGKYAAEQKEFIKSMARGAKRDLVYFEDERTGLCYAYIWGGDSHGGPALTLVPREKVEHLLIK